MIPPLYSMKPSFLNLFMKKLTRGRVVPIISAGEIRAGLKAAATSVRGPIQKGMFKTAKVTGWIPAGRRAFEPAADKG